MPQTVKIIQPGTLIDEPMAFKNIYLEFFPRLFVFARTIVKEKALAEDVVEEVFLKLWENRKLLPTIKNPAYYLFVATKHACLNALQKQKRVTSIAWDHVDEQFYFSLSSPETEMMSKENLRLIEDAFSSLPARCRLIFYLVKEENLRYREIAQILDISVKTVEAQMTIAFKRISQQLSKSMPFEMKHIRYRRG